jgi:hydrogenase nickel incorporation protein HypA/HybF
MHELSMVQSIMDAVRRQLPPGENRPVKSVTLMLGELARIVPESLAYCFEIASAGTELQGAKLKIRNVPIRCRCPMCTAGFEVGRYLTICPHCGNSGVELLSGNEMHLVEVECSDGEAGRDVSRNEGMMF